MQKIEGKKVNCGQQNMQYICSEGLFKMNQETQQREYFCKKLEGWCASGAYSCQPFLHATQNHK